MSNVQVKSAQKRVTYGFPLEFPVQFTIRQLAHVKRGRVKYITLYMRVKSALKNGELVVAGEKIPQAARRGRKELIFRRVDAPVAAQVSAVPVAA